PAPTRQSARDQWFHRESSTNVAQRPRVLVLWLDQDDFRDAPLQRFSEIVNFIAPAEAGSAAVSEVILGPADSDGLKEMSSELDQGCQFLSASQRNISIYSPRATALDWWIVSDAVKKRYPDTQSEAHADHFNDRCEKGGFFCTVFLHFSFLKKL